MFNEEIRIKQGLSDISFCSFRILYDSKLILMATSLVTKAVIVSRVRYHLYKFYPLKLHFDIVKLGFTGIYIIFLISTLKQRLWVLVRTASARRF